MDNAVPLSAITLGVLVLVGLAILGIAAFRLWRALRVVQRRVTTAGEALAAEGERLSATAAQLPERQAEIQASVAALQARVAVLTSIANSASEAIEVLRAPLRYLGR